MQTPAKKGEYIALAGLVLSGVSFALTFLLSRWANLPVISAISWQVLTSALIWLVLLIQFHQRALAQQEKLDLAQLTRTKTSETIFQAGPESTGLYAVAQRRLLVLEKWFIPIFAIIIAAYQIAIGLYLFRQASLQHEPETNRFLVSSVYMAAAAFVSFLICRYATGMASQPQYKPLRAGAGFLCATAILCFCAAIGLALAQFKITAVIHILAWCVPVLLIVLGSETTLNFILDIYRPKLKGRYARVAFDSRLLSLINEPGSVLRTAASTIDYQFGFKVSQTWFYKLVQKAVIPLVLFSVLTLYLLSCIVIIEPGEEAVIEHFGKPVTTGQDKTFGPGLVIKWPWPIDIAYKYHTTRIQQLNIGFVPSPDAEHVRVPLLWGQEHYEKEYDILIATETETEQTESSLVPVTIIRAAVPVQYRIKDLRAFMYNHSDARKILEALCYRELVRFAASAKIETYSETSTAGISDENQSLLGAGRAQAAKTLMKRIQSAADSQNLGVEVVFVGLQGVHPPPQVAEDYQNVVGAMQERQADVLKALADRNIILCSLAGSVEKAEQLYALAAQYRRLKAQAQPGQTERATRELNAAFENASGDIFAFFSRCLHCLILLLFH